MIQADQAQALRALHVKGRPLILYNIWDAGSAKAVADAGSQALATGSWSVATALGFADGEMLPMAVLLNIVRRIVATVDIPVSVDFEGAYAVDPETVAANTGRLIETGASGLNFEDQRIGGSGIYPISEQVLRISAMRKAATDADMPLVINARTDLFLKEPDQGKHSALISEALERATAYAEAGGDCFFVPGLTDKDLIARLCDGASLPINIMHSGAPSEIPALAAVGVSRISHGPNPYRWAMGWLGDQANAALTA